MGYDRTPTSTAAEGCTVRLLWVVGSPAFKQPPHVTLLGWDPTGALLRVRRYNAPRAETWDALSGEVVPTSDPSDEGQAKFDSWAFVQSGATFVERAGTAPLTISVREPVTASRDGTVLLARKRGGNRLLVWRADGSFGSQLTPPANAELRHALFADGDRAVVAGLGDGSLACWDVATGTLRWCVPAHRGEVCALACPADGATLYTFGLDDTLRATSLAGEARWQTPLPRNPSSWAKAGIQLSASPDDKLVALARARRALRVFDAASGAERSTIEGHDGSVTSVAVSPDGRLVASGADDGEVLVADAATGERQWSFETEGGAVGSVEFLPDRPALRVGAGDGAVQRWNLATGLCEERHAPRPRANTSTIGALDGSRVLVVRGSDIEVLSDHGAERVAWSAELGGGRERLVGFDDRGGRILVLEGGASGWELKALDAESGRALGTVRRTAPGLALTETYGGLVSVTRDRDDLLVNGEWGDARTQRRVPGATGVTRVALSTDGRRLVAVGPLRMAVWSLDPTPWLVGEVDLTPIEDHVTALALSADGAIVAAGTARGSVLAFAVDAPG